MHEGFEYEFTIPSTISQASMCARDSEKVKITSERAMTSGQTDGKTTLTRWLRRECELASETQAAGRDPETHPEARNPMDVM